MADKDLMMAGGAAAILALIVAALTKNKGGKGLLSRLKGSPGSYAAQRLSRSDALGMLSRGGMGAPGSMGASRPAG